MKKHLDLFLAVVAIVAVGDAASIFGQGPVQQQQQQQLGGFGPPGINGAFSGATGGGLGGSQGSSLGPFPGSLPGGGGAGGTDGSRRTGLGGLIGGASGVPGPRGLLGTDSTGGPFSHGGSGRTASGPDVGSLGGGSGGGLASSVLGSRTQRLQQGVPGLGGVLPGTRDGVFAGGSGGGPGGGLRSALGGEPGAIGGAGRGGAIDESRRGLLGGDFGDGGGVAGPGGLFGGRNAGGPSNRVVGGPAERGPGTGYLSSASGDVPGLGVSALSPSTGRAGPLSPGGRAGSGAAARPFTTPSLSSGSASPFGTETGRGSSFSSLPAGVPGSALSSSLGSGGPLSPGGTGGTGVARGPFSAPSLPNGPPPPVGSETSPGNTFPSLPVGVSVSGLPIAGSSSTSGSTGPGGAISSGGPGSLSPTEPGSERAGQRLRGGSLPGRRPSPHGHRPGKLSPEKAAAIGLGAASTAMALGALAATIASAVQHRQRLRKLGRTGTGCVGCRPTPCVGNCGRKRRSIAKSKVPADILDSIPVNFERLY